MNVLILDTDHLRLAWTRDWTHFHLQRSSEFRIAALHCVTVDDVIYGIENARADVLLVGSVEDGATNFRFYQALAARVRDLPSLDVASVSSDGQRNRIPSCGAVRDAIVATDFGAEDLGLFIGSCQFPKRGI